MDTRILFSEELKYLRYDILAMATKVEENIGKALTALKTCNTELANEVRADDAEVDALQLKIEDDAAILIATQQPVARDMREILAIYKITGNIERVGDYAVHLAKAAKKLAKRGESPFRAQEYLERMAETGREMLRAAVTAFLQQDAQAARESAALDQKIDAEHKALTENVLKLMKNHPELVKSAVRILRASNQLERLGDHVTTICEAVIYMIEGKHEDLNE